VGHGFVIDGIKGRRADGTFVRVVLSNVVERRKRMAMTGIRGQGAHINVTPMIDILLVLIIVFMVIAPSLSVGLNASVPQPGPVEANSQRQQDIVVTVLGSGNVRIGPRSIAMAELPNHLRLLLGSRVPGVVFVHAVEGLDFRDVAEVIDAAKGAGVSRVALMPR
jgi:biopolymer transport protein ExbD